MQHLALIIQAFTEQNYLVPPLGDKRLAMQHEETKTRLVHNVHSMWCCHGYKAVDNRSNQ